MLKNNRMDHSIPHCKNLGCIFMDRINLEIDKSYIFPDRRKPESTKL